MTGRKDYYDAQRKVKNLEKVAADLEDKLSFTVEKFEEQNMRFMECGKELADTQDRCAKLELIIR